ncbi:hypothetical protein COV20_00490 [Candidatus Woesearchaeota archaeon CG10_big_fil_rev_8_21_14_0_10_45_16]|nr:MAG: hypothetical protein COV20_00490 [Candidatus Woesearchaeota archaeon CG10_big_fil_rev_8_21_14_0_10_45_16]
MFDLSQIQKLSEKFQQNQPFPHLLLHDLLDKEEVSSLLKALQKEEFQLKDSDLFTFLQTDDLQSSSDKAVRKFCQFLSKTVAPLLEKITSVELTGKLDLSGTLYKNTHHLLPHDDKLEGRKVAFIYYLSSLEKKDGGALALYSAKDGKPLKIAKRIQPQFNTFIIFQVLPESFHEVEEVIVNKERLAVSGWFL